MAAVSRRKPMATRPSLPSLPSKSNRSADLSKPTALRFCVSRCPNFLIARCSICDGVEDEPGGEGDERIAEDQSEPILTWAGEKLRPEWTTQLLLGQLDYKLRPWLRARMPAFPARANLLAHALPLDHGFAPISLPPPTPDDKLVPFGRKLLSKDGGFACTTCHG